MDDQQYRVKPGQRAKLSDFSTDDKGGLDKAKGQAETAKLAEELAEWQERLYAEGKQSLLLILQARDAAGKDGAVKKVIGAFNPAGVQIANFKQPTAEELAHDFLWRIHKEAPRKGYVGVFNRSHYEDVLVTRVYDMIDDATAEQRLKHIRHFEELLTDSGTRIVKVYLHISKDEQKERLQARLDESDKNWKFNPGDLKDRANWDKFTDAYEAAFETSTDAAPWYIVPSDHKWYRDLVLSQILLDTLKDMNPQYPEIDYDPTQTKID